VHLAEAIAVLVARILAAPVADGLVPVAPGLQPGIDVVPVGVDEGAESGVKRNIPGPCTRGKRPGAQAWAERSLTRSGR
jgi:hypothetical protein